MRRLGYPIIYCRIWLDLLLRRGGIISVLPHFYYRNLFKSMNNSHRFRYAAMGGGGPGDLP